MPLVVNGVEILAINGQPLDYSVYLATCLVNGVSHGYVGVTRRSVDSRRRGHLRDAKNNVQRPFAQALARYSAESFSFETLDTGLTMADAHKKERQYISELKTRWGKEGHRGWNATDGGEGLRDDDGWSRRMEQLVWHLQRFKQWPKPNRHPELCEWMKTQKAEYARGDLSPLRASQLESLKVASLRWAWNSNDAWNDTLKNLKVHLWTQKAWPKPTGKSPQERSLYSWVAQQKRDQKEPRQYWCALTKLREKELSELRVPNGVPGWNEWGSIRTVERGSLYWMNKYEEAVAFVNIYGAPRNGMQISRGANHEEHRVYHWWTTQKCKHSAGKLTEEQAEAVRKLGEHIDAAKKRKPEKSKTHNK